MKKALARRERGSRSIATPACAHLLDVAYGASPPLYHSWAPRAPLRLLRKPVPSSNFGKKDLWYLNDFSSIWRGALALRAQRSIVSSHLSLSLGSRRTGNSSSFRVVRAAEPNSTTARPTALARATR